jgi:hypothetical protein
MAADLGTTIRQPISMSISNIGYVFQNGADSEKRNVLKKWRQIDYSQLYPAEQRLYDSLLQTIISDPVFGESSSCCERLGKVWKESITWVQNTIVPATKRSFTRSVSWLQRQFQDNLSPVANRVCEIAREKIGKKNGIIIGGVVASGLVFGFPGMIFAGAGYGIYRLFASACKQNQVSSSSYSRAYAASLAGDRSSQQDDCTGDFGQPSKHLS